MFRNLKYKISILLIIIVALNLQAQLEIEAELRPRFEYRDGYKISYESSGKPSVLISFRTRVSFNYKISKFSVGIVPQDTRVAYNQLSLRHTGINIANPGLHFREVWVGYSPNDFLTITIGRQVKYLNDQRLMAKRNWSQDGLGYDMIGLEFKKPGISIQTGISYNFLPDKYYSDDYPNSTYKTFDFLNISTQFYEKHHISLISVICGIQDTIRTHSLSYQQTSGIFYEYIDQTFSIHGSGYYQFGRNCDRQIVSSLLVDIHGNIFLEKFSISPGTVILSGNSRTIGTDKDHTFDLLYGVRHSFYGLMDHFRETDESTDSSGFIDNYLLFSTNVESKFNVEIGLHAISLASNYYKSLTGFELLKKFMVFESDFIANYRIAEDLNLEAGYCFLIPSKTFKSFRESQDLKLSNFAFVMITYQPCFFKK